MRERLASQTARWVLLVVAVAVVCSGVGVAVAAPWESDQHGLDALGPAKSSTGTPGTTPSRRHVIGAPPPSSLTADQITGVVDAHNQWRQKFGVTQQVAWDDTLGAVAQEWANRIATTGAFDHRPDSGPDAVPYGENLFAWWASGNPDDTITPAYVVGKWGDESADYDRTALTCAAGKVCGHFTQVVWATTTKVGCGKAVSPTDPGQVYWVCNYDPPGNFGGVNPFTGARLP